MRGNAETTLPLDSRIRSGRLCAAVEDVIHQFENDMSSLKEEAMIKEKQKHTAEISLQNMKDELQNYRVLSEPFTLSIY